MPVNRENYRSISTELGIKKVALVAVSKTKPVEEIRELYEMGHRDFGENYVQELVEKEQALPKDIRWHFIGHLQSNKVKYIAPFVHLVHGVDSLKLLKEINKQGVNNQRVMDCLLQMHIAKEETKFGLDEQELTELMKQRSTLQQVRITGLMGMATFTGDMNRVREEFSYLKKIFDQWRSADASPEFQVLSMGMSGDYPVAIEEGSTMVRIGSLIFGEREIK